MKLSLRFLALGLSAAVLACGHPGEREGAAGPKGLALKVTSNTDVPRRIGGRQPEYPPAVGRRGIQGVVVLEVSIERDGHVSSARLVKGVESVLDRGALDAALTWRYQPPVVGNKPISLKLLETVTYRKYGNELSVSVSNRPGRRVE